MKEENNKNSEKIQSLREMIYTAEKTLQGAKAMLLQLEGKKKVGRRKKMTAESSEEGTIIEGVFDGQVMVGTDSKQYPIPANYASKSKLVAGDMLKLTITPEGSFIYKQIGPVERKRVIGIVSLDSDNNYFVAAEGKAYKVLLASITYFKVEPGDEVTLVTPRDLDSDWGSIENVLQKNKTESNQTSNSDIIKENSDIIKELEKDTPKTKTTQPITPSENSSDTTIADEWEPDLEELKEELRKSTSN
jgi:hypothetical protein